MYIVFYACISSICDGVHIYLLNFQISLFTHLADAAFWIELFNWFKSLRRMRLYRFPLKSTMQQSFVFFFSFKLLLSLYL